MTFWAKLLTVFILILSVLFAAVSTVLFATKTEWRQAYDVARQQHRDDVRSLESRVSGLEGELKAITTQRDELKRSEADLKSAKDGLEKLVARLETDNKDKSMTLNTLNANLVDLQEEKKTWQPQIADLRTRLEQRTEQLRVETARLQEMTRESEKLALANSNLSEELIQTRIKLNEASETLAAKERILADLGKVYPDLRDYVDTIGAIPVQRVQGKVIAVDNESNMAVINVGAKAGVKREYQFTVYRGTQFKGIIRVFELEGDNLAAGRIELLARDEQGNPRQIEIGDDVKTGIGF